MYLLRRIEAVLVKELNNMRVIPITHKHSTCGRDNKKLQGGLLQRKKGGAKEARKEARQEIRAARAEFRDAQRANRRENKENPSREAQKLGRQANKEEKKRSIEEAKRKRKARIFVSKLPEREIPTAPFERKRKNAPSRKKSLGYYNKANKTGTGAKAGGGMSAKGVAKYRRDNPGSKLKTAVTTPPSKLKKGSKAAKRRKSFCARSRSWKSERGRAARRRWNC